ncbi:cytochrome P450 [Paenibacillus sp. 481]|nr:cytochrome P450 [Paenibacillus sp. 481]
MKWSVSEQLIPYSWFKQMRDEQPIYFDEQTQMWNVFRYHDIKSILGNHHIFSSHQEKEEYTPFEESILFIDPPRHKQLRSLVAKAFTPRAIEALTPRIIQITNEWLDRVLEQGTMNVVADFASPLPVTIIAEMLGIQSQDRDKFREWSLALVTFDPAQMLKPQQEMTPYFTEIANERRKRPQNDLISALVQVKEEGIQLSDAELIGFCILLLVAGNETTTNLITATLLCIANEPAAYQQVMSNHERIPSLIEETLRYASPVQSTQRFITEDVTFQGHPFKAGQTVLTWLASGNQDEAVFEQPHLFDMNRSPNPHLTFGHGIHFCLGVMLARLEAKITFSSLLSRTRNIKIADHAVLERINSQSIFGLTELPITFEAQNCPN